MVERQTERKVKKLRTDNGMEFCSNEFESYCKSEGIVRRLCMLNFVTGQRSSLQDFTIGSI